MRLSLYLLAAVLVTALLPAAPNTARAAQTGARELELTSVTSGLSTPVDLRAPKGDERLFIVELSGRIVIYENGSLNSTPFLDIEGRVSIGGELGLVGLDFHPDYEDNGLFYVFYTDNGGDVRISEFSVSSGDEDVADSGSERILLEVDQPASNHNGGGLAFGPNGYLYIALGDGGGGGDPDENGQDTSTLLGALLRIDVDDQEGGLEYAIPDENPFVATTGRDEIYAYGLRNPFRISVDDASGQLFIGDVGQDRREEIDVLEVDEDSALNFGWDVMEGSLCFEPASGCNTSGKTLPVLEYVNPTEGTSVIGGYVYRGNSIPWLRGTYFYSDLSGRRLKSFRYEGTSVTDETDWTSDVGLIPSVVYSFGVDGFGELYVLSGSSVYRIEDANPGRCDFNGDGDDDLAIGVPGENRNGVADVGAVIVAPASGGKPGSAGSSFWTQDSPGVAGGPDSGGQFGSALACGDFNGDGYDDLAVGTPRDRHLGGPNAGSINIIEGSPQGLDGSGQFFNQDSPGVGGVPEEGDGFGSTLAAGDFDGDGYDDLAIGAPGEDTGSVADTGMVHILNGTSSGLTGSGSKSWRQDTAGIKGVEEAGDQFGAALASGDFNGDGLFDLAIGVAGEDVGPDIDAGMVQVFRGRAGSGLSVSGDLALHQDEPGVAGGAESGDRFGASLSTGTINADGFDELVVGIPGETLSGSVGAGAIHVFLGSESFTSVDGDQLIHQDVAGVRGNAEAGDAFGSSVAVGDLDSDRFGDVVVGIPGEDILSDQDAGGVAVLYGGVDGASTQDQFWHEDSSGVNGINEDGDGFGSSVGVFRFGQDGHEDLVIGIPFEDLGLVTDAGDVSILFGGDQLLSSSGDKRINQDTPGIPGGAGPGDVLGSFLPQ